MTSGAAIAHVLIASVMQKHPNQDVKKADLKQNKRIDLQQKPTTF